MTEELICFWCKKTIEYVFTEEEPIKKNRNYAHQKCSKEIFETGKAIEGTNKRLVEVKGKTYLLGKGEVIEAEKDD